MVIIFQIFIVRFIGLVGRAQRIPNQVGIQNAGSGIIGERISASANYFIVCVGIKSVCGCFTQSTNIKISVSCNAGRKIYIQLTCFTFFRKQLDNAIGTLCSINSGSSGPLNNFYPFHTTEIN